MSEPLVNLQEGNHVATITLNRPKALNAFTPDSLRALTAAVKKVEQSARVIILEGAGRAFSAGVDLKLPQKRSRATTRRSLTPWIA